MIRKNILSAVIVLLSCYSSAGISAPAVTDQPIQVQHRGIIDWPQAETVA